MPNLRLRVRELAGGKENDRGSTTSGGTVLGARSLGQWSLAATMMMVGVMVACGAEEGEEAGNGWTSAVDTIDSRVQVLNIPPGAGPTATLVAEEELRIGTVSGTGPTSFGRIRSVAVLPDGRLAVADAQAEEVRLFDPQGIHLRTLGGEGAGPGELSGMQGVHVDHEGLLRVAEQGNSRLSVFHPDSGFVTSYPLRLFSSSFAGPWEAAMDSAGRTFVASSGQYGEGRFWSMLRVYDASMSQIDSTPYYDYTDDARGDEDPPGAWQVNLDRGRMFAPVPFYSRPHQVLTSTGQFWSSAPGATQLEVYRWQATGDTSLVLLSERQPHPVTSSERDSAMEEVRTRLSERVPGDLPSFDPSRVPATKPPVYDLSLDDQGYLWVRVSDPALDSTVYDVFTREGRHAETVALPFRIDMWVPPVVRGDTLWAVVTDDLDVQHVVRARLREVVSPDA